jgi:flavin-dependent thymidylate synthase
MHVELLSYTPDALDLLLFTKSTRLTMNGVGLAEVRAWPEARKWAELEKMRATIQSSWEFVEYTFAISGVSRAFTHQLVRQRVGTSFAQQSQRAVDMSGFEFITPDKIAADRHPVDGDVGALLDEWNCDMRKISDMYAELLSLGAEHQDARGILPTNVSTNIVFKANLRTLHEMALKRLCVRTQGEYQDVFRALLEEVFRVHAWARPFLRVHCAWHGTCAFPLLPNDQCHIKPSVYDQETGTAYDGGTPATINEIQHMFQITPRRSTQPPVAK